MTSRTYLLLIFSTFLILFGCQPEWIKRAPEYDYSGMDKRTIDVHKKAERFLARAVILEDPFYVHPATRIREVKVDSESGYIEILLSRHFSFIPLREESVDQLYRSLYDELGGSYREYRVILKSTNQPIEELIPNIFRSNPERYDFARMPDPLKPRPEPLVRNISKPWKPSEGLYGFNIALWHSHGWYYNPYIDRWEWQRPRLFQTVEDIFPLSFTLPYIIPMLENAGALTFVPRERDIQQHEVIVDNDSMGGQSQVIAYSENREADQAIWFTGERPAFGIGSPPYEEGENPFRQGTHRFTWSDTVETAHIDWIPYIPEPGEYAVYISFVSSPESVDDAHYTVFHDGGKTEFLVNQQIGGQTWVYLGTFYFNSGFSQTEGMVRLDNKSRTAGMKISADAVRFGGGMGVIARNGRTSGRARFLEAARYYMQFSGFPDSLVYSLSGGKNDYTDDYQGRPEYVNYLMGAPFGPNKDRQAEGLGIPVDLSLAFHTDAGITRNDTTIGTLSIYSTEGADTQYVFPDSVSRMANRDYADILQTELVKDIRRTWDPAWNRRQLMDSKYSEAYRPNIPSALLELLSHQNFLDMKFGMDPRFRFTASRSIYKSMLKFINHRYGRPYTVQPLAVTHFSAVFDSAGDIRLNWKHQTDPLEPSSEADGYLVYMSDGPGGFDNGTLVTDRHYVFTDPEPGILYRFRVTAVNDGGESFPSEILAACRMDTEKPPVLIINGFDRICAPAWFEEQDMSGFLNVRDNGVPDGYDLNFTGLQHDFDPDSPFRVNDAPGHGASFADLETTVIPGNTFDFTAVHGRSVRAAGYSFVSSSDESVMDGLIDMNNYAVVDLLLGEEKQTSWQRSRMDTLIGVSFKTFPEKFKRQIRRYSLNGGNLMISGAHVATDLFEGQESLYPDMLFARQALKFNWVTSHAARTGLVHTVDDSLFPRLKFRFNTQIHPDIYTVEAPDALAPYGGSRIIMRYSENEFGAGVAYRDEYGLLVMGFPFETIMDEKQRDELMKAILTFFERDNGSE